MKGNEDDFCLMTNVTVYAVNLILILPILTKPHLVSRLLD